MRMPAPSHPYIGLATYRLQTVRFVEEGGKKALVVGEHLPHYGQQRLRPEQRLVGRFDPGRRGGAVQDVPPEALLEHPLPRIHLEAGRDLTTPDVHEGASRVM